jgi:opacity protein-like surface antigen
LIYYFGNNYIAAYYNLSHTQNRGKAQWGTLKGNFAVNDRLSFWIGQAIGERLYDIWILPASKQYGYIYFCGVDLRVTKSLNLQLGYSYSRERPDFLKRSLEFGLSFKL